MSTVAQSIPLLLRRVPDARRASVPLFPPVLLPYLGLILGSAVAAACAFYNAIALRRWRLAVGAVAVGILGWVGFGIAVSLALRAGLPHVVLALLPARLWNIALGALLAWMQWAHVRGHRFLDGRAVPLVPTVLVAFVIAISLPWRARLVLQGLWPLLFLG